MQTEWLYSFVETVHWGSLTKAGEKLNISQTALSKQIKNLEDNFGVSLFTRTTAGMELTPEGELLYEKVQVWLREIDNTKRQLKNIESVREVIFGCIPSIASYYLPRKVLELKAEGIKADVRIFDSSSAVWDAFIAGDIDVAIVDRITNIPKIYPNANLFSEPYFAVIPSTHHLSSQSKVRIQDMIQEPFVLYPAKCDIRKTLTQTIPDLVDSMHIAQEIPFGEAIQGFVAAGAGITILPEMIAQHLSDPNLTAVQIVDVGLERTVCLAAKSTEQFKFFRKYFRQSKKVVV